MEGGGRKTEDGRQRTKDEGRTHITLNILILQVERLQCTELDVSPNDDATRTRRDARAPRCRCRGGGSALWDRGSVSSG